jgi:transcriptional regulator of acetoin/glycerol metabolism
MGERAEFEARRQADLAAFKTLEQVEREAIRRAEELCQGNRELMSKVLGMPRTTLFRRLAQYRRDNQ